MTNCFWSKINKNDCKINRIWTSQDQTLNLHSGKLTHARLESVSTLKNQLKFVIISIEEAAVQVFGLLNTAAFQKKNGNPRWATKNLWYYIFMIHSWKNT